MGGANEGGYVICTNFFEQSEAFVNIGIAGTDDLGCEITTKKVMPNYQYDCTDYNFKEPVCSTNKNSNHFSKVCIGEKSETTSEYTYHTLEDILRTRGLIHKHITLKVDTEGGEIPAFKYFPLEYLDYIDVIIMELHFEYINPERWGNL